jgi:hypothetical protein
VTALIAAAALVAAVMAAFGRWRGRHLVARVFAVAASGLAALLLLAAGHVAEAVVIGLCGWWLAVHLRRRATQRKEAPGQ